MTEIAVYQAAGSGRLTVTQTLDGYGYTFRITGRNHRLTVSDDEATELAEAILACTRATPA